MNVKNNVRIVKEYDSKLNIANVPTTTVMYKLLIFLFFVYSYKKYMNKSIRNEPKDRVSNLKVLLPAPTESIK